MRQDKYTLPDSELESIARLRPLRPCITEGGCKVRRHFFDSFYYEDALEPEVADLRYLSPPALMNFHNHRTEYLLVYRGVPDFPVNIPLAWFDSNESDNWYIPYLSKSCSPSLARIRSFVEGLRWGRETAPSTRKAVLP